MGQNAVVELSYAMIFFSYGILCGIIYRIINAFCKILHAKKLVSYLVDCIYVTCCYIPFYYYYVNALDGVLHFYQAVFFVVGLVFYTKYITPLDIKIISYVKQKYPNKLINLFKSIKNVLYK